MYQPFVIDVTPTDPEDRKRHAETNFWISAVAMSMVLTTFSVFLCVAISGDALETSFALCSLASVLLICAVPPVGRMSHWIVALVVLPAAAAWVAAWVPISAVAVVGYWLIKGCLEESAAKGCNVDELV
mgnify:CR=1 FL=1